MSRWPRRAPRITALLNKDESDFDDDLRFHVERAAAELVAAGWSEEDARAEVLRRFGDVEATRRYSALMNRRYERAMRSRRTTMGLAQDIGFALRQIVRRPAVATVVVLTLGLGIGAVTAMFALIDGILLRPLPYHEPDRLVRIWDTRSGGGWTQANPNPSNFRDWQSQLASFERLAGVAGATMTLNDPQGAGRGDSDLAWRLGASLW
jgi:hypothetical protein